jgi:hypothetical protein
MFLGQVLRSLVETLTYIYSIILEGNYLKVVNALKAFDRTKLVHIW